MNKVMVLLLGLTLLLGGCTTRYATDGTDGSPKIAYIGEEQEMLKDIQMIMFDVFPGRKLTPVEGHIKGYSTWTRYFIDSYTQRAVLVPTKATTSDGNETNGFMINVSGSGSSRLGMVKNKELFTTLKTKFDATYKTGIPR